MNISSKGFLPSILKIPFTKKIDLEKIAGEKNIAYKVFCPWDTDIGEIKEKYLTALTGALSGIFRNPQRDFARIEHPRLLENLERIFEGDATEKIKCLYSAAIIFEKIPNEALGDAGGGVDNKPEFEPQLVHNEVPLMLHLLKNFDSAKIEPQKDFIIPRIPRGATNLSVFCPVNTEIDIDRMNTRLLEQGLDIRIENPTGLKEIPEGFVFYKFTRIPNNEEVGRNFILIKLRSTDYQFIVKKIPGKKVDPILTTRFPVYDNQYPLFDTDKPVLYRDGRVFALCDQVTRADDQKKVKDLFTDSCPRKGYIKQITPVDFSDGDQGQDKVSLVIGKFNFIASEQAGDQNFTKEEVTFGSSIHFGANHLVFNRAGPVIDRRAFIGLEFDFVSGNWWLVEKANFYHKKAWVETQAKERLSPDDSKTIRKGTEQWEINYYNFHKKGNGFYLTLFEGVEKVEFYIYVGSGHEAVTSIVPESIENLHENYAGEILGEDALLFPTASEGTIYTGRVKDRKAFLKIYNKVDEWSVEQQEEFYKKIIADVLMFRVKPLKGEISDLDDTIYLGIDEFSGYENVVTLMPEFSGLVVTPPKRTKIIRQMVNFIKHCSNAGFYCFDLLLFSEANHLSSNWNTHRDRLFNVDLGAYYKKGDFNEFKRYLKSVNLQKISDFNDPNICQMYLLGVLLFQVWNRSVSIPDFQSTVEIAGKAGLGDIVNELIGGKCLGLTEELMARIKKALI